MGGIYIYKRGKTYWVKYYRDGKPYYESTKSEKEGEAGEACVWSAWAR